MEPENEDYSGNPTIDERYPETNKKGIIEYRQQIGGVDEGSYAKRPYGAVISRHVVPTLDESIMDQCPASTDDDSDCEDEVDGNDKGNSECHDEECEEDESSSEV